MNKPEIRSSAYINKGLTGVIRISAVRNEGLPTEQHSTTTEELAGVVDGEHWLIRFTRIKLLSLIELPKDTLEKTKRISLEEYKQLARRHGVILDSLPQFVAQQKKEILEHIGRFTPRCATCDAGMVLKSGIHGRFWSCQTFPKCNGSRTANQGELAIIDKLQTRLSYIGT